jgi:hypothetical protein
MLPAERELPTQTVLKHPTTPARIPTLQDISRRSGRKRQNRLPGETSPKSGR